MVMQDKVTLDWLERRALSVLAELMTSDDERIALRAAQATLAMLHEQNGTMGREGDKSVPMRPIPRVVRPPDDAVKSGSNPRPGIIKDPPRINWRVSFVGVIQRI